MKTLLVIGYVWPEPRSSAAGYHMLSLLRLFHNSQWQITFASPAKPTDYMHDLSTLGIDCQSIQPNDNHFDVWVSELKPDMVLFDRFLMEEQFGWRIEQACPNAMRLLDTEDLWCLRHARHNAHKERREMTYHDLNSDLAKREIAAIFRSDLSLIISDFEFQLLQDRFSVPPQQLHLLPFMVSTGSRPNSNSCFEARNHFITIGNFKHAPNWDSVLYLKQLWPAIRKQLPEAELHIYGAYMPEKAAALHDAQSGFLVKGRAEDALQVMEKARVCLAPLRFGAGIKGKLLDAMITGTPSVTTPIGAEGMTRGHPWPGIIADDEPDFVQAAVGLYLDKEQWQSAHNQTQELLSDVFDADRSSAELLDRVETLLIQLEQHRSQHFIGAMLRHHSLKSTQYMSRWIETKNELQQQQKPS